MATSPQASITLLGKSIWQDLVFWFAYGLFWHIVFAPEAFTIDNLMVSGLLTFWQAFATYAHIYFLLEPRYQKRISTFLYVTCIIPLILVVSSLSWGSIYLLFRFILGEAATETFLDNSVSYWQGSILGGLGMAVAITGVIHLFRRRREQEQREQQLEKARTEAELAYLRGQLNPHFLFNALNSIYFLIPKAPEEAQTALSGFSDLLRYQLYRSEEKLVPLAEELAHLHKFAKLSQLRMEAGFTFAISEPTNLNGQQVPPMLLLPLVENAIKYSPAGGGKVTGLVDLKDGRLRFTLTNKVGERIMPPAAAAGESAGGIGLTNINRRLNLLFPNNHTFATREQDGHYTVNLEIPLAQ